MKKPFERGRGNSVNYRYMFGPVVGSNNKTIGTHKVTVPTGFWKVVARDKQNALAFYMDNKTITKGDIAPYQIGLSSVARLMLA